MDNLIFGKVINVKAAADGPDVGAKIEVFIQSQHMPIDLITWFGKSVTIKDQIEKLKKTPLEEEADRQRERDDARRFEALAEQPADIPQDHTDPETCEYCQFGSIEADSCSHPDGKPEQPTGLDAWSCGNFSRRVAVVDAEDPVELCLAENCSHWIGPGNEASACGWGEEEIDLVKDDQGNWLRHQACLEEAIADAEAKPEPAEDEIHCDDGECPGFQTIGETGICTTYGEIELVIDDDAGQWLRCEACIEEAMKATRELPEELKEITEHCHICPEHSEDDDGVVSCGLPPETKCVEMVTHNLSPQEAPVKKKRGKKAEARA